MKMLLLKLGRGFIFYLISILSTLFIATLPFWLLVLGSLLTLESMHSLAGENYNLAGTEDYSLEIGKGISEAYKTKAIEWTIGLTEDQIRQVLSAGLEMQYSVMLAYDKFQHNFEPSIFGNPPDLEGYIKIKNYMDDTFNLLRPNYVWRDSEVKTKIVSYEWNEETEENEEIIREYIEIRKLLLQAITYQGVFDFHYEEKTGYSEWYGENGVEKTWVTYENITKIDSALTYEKLRNAIKNIEFVYGKDFTNENNIDLLIFQAYAFDPNLKDPKIESLLPPDMIKVRSRGYYGMNTDLPRSENGVLNLLAPLIKDVVPNEFERKLSAKIQLYGQPFRMDKGRTVLNTSPRRGTNGKFGTIAVAQNNPYGLELGMKVYIPRYGYAVVEEYSDNVIDPGMGDDRNWLERAIDWLFDIDLLDDATDFLIGATKKEEVIYLFVGDTHTSLDKDDFATTATKDWRIKEGFSVGDAVKWYDDSLIYILQSSYSIPFTPYMYEENDRVFFDGNTWRLTSHYGRRIDPISGERSFHIGTDFGVPSGTPILAIGSGTIVDQGRTTGGGNYIKIKLDLKAKEGSELKDIEIRYLHLSGFAVPSNYRVSQGDVIAFSGNTGTNTTGAHVHMEVYIGGTHRDPLNWIPFLPIAEGEIDVIGDQPYFGGDIDEH